MNEYTSRPHEAPVWVNRRAHTIGDVVLGHTTTHEEHEYWLATDIVDEIIENDSSLQRAAVSSAVNAVANYIGLQHGQDSDVFKLQEEQSRSRTSALIRSDVFIKAVENADDVPRLGPNNTLPLDEFIARQSAQAAE